MRGVADTKLQRLITMPGAAREVRPILLTVCRSFIFWVNKMRRIGGEESCAGFQEPGTKMLTAPA